MEWWQSIRSYKRSTGRSSTATSASAIGDSLSADCVLRESTMRPVQAWAMTIALVPMIVILMWVGIFSVMKSLRKDERYTKVHLPVSIIITLLFANTTLILDRYSLFNLFIIFFEY